MNKPNFQVWDINKVIPYHLNSKIHNEDQVKRIAKSIKEFGFDQPIVVDKDGVIIKGHGRRLACISLGIQQVPVLVRDDLTVEQVRASRLADNRVALGDIDTNLLKKELETLNFDLAGIFDLKELEFMAADLATLTDDVFVGDVNDEVVKQAIETAGKMAKEDEKPIPIEKILGFNKIKGGDQRTLVRFMALVEEFGDTPEAAFVNFAKHYLESQK